MDIDPKLAVALAMWIPAVVIWLIYGLLKLMRSYQTSPLLTLQWVTLFVVVLGCVGAWL